MSEPVFSSPLSLAHSFSANDKFLGIDYGEARIGIALSYGTLAEPLVVLQNDGTQWSLFHEIAQEYGISHLIIGQSEQEMAQKSIDFAKQLAQELQLPFFLTDETLSSREVQQKLREKNTGKRQYRGPIDHYAAAVILQRFLDDANFTL